ncbi:MAG TPA: hypothetical protein VM223_01970 [Planctomycetota bacterium]|nr:hypothetical protein [Planctomycetota bacterium]
MPKVENDETKYLARPAVIIASVRSGGTFLAHCLSNHPQIFCDRGESLHYRSLWHTQLTLDRAKLLFCLTHMQGYQVSMCKLIYQQAFLREVWDYITGFPAIPVIWLRRENTIRQAVSHVLNQTARQGNIKRPQHTFGRVETICVELAPEHVLHVARGLLKQDQRVRKQLGTLKPLALTYEQIIGPASTLADEATRRICEFLGVRYEPLGCELTRINPQPLAEMIANWEAVREVIGGSEFAHCLKDEPE